MSKQIYRKAMASVIPSENLIRQTAALMRNVQANKRRFNMRFKRYSLSGSLLLAICAFVLLMIGEQVPQEKARNSTGTPPAIGQPITVGPHRKPNIMDSSAVMAQIKSYFIPFQASEYAPVRAPFPHFPLEYETLKQESSAIVKVTITDADVYRDKDAVYNPRASFGTYIYVAQVETVLYGEGIEEETLIPISEQAWAMLSEEAEEPTWSFKPYTARPLQELQYGEQYILFLHEKDARETYPVVGDGFGIFSLEEMKSEADSYTLEQLREMHETNMKETSSPMKNNLLYRLFAVQAYNDFEDVLNK